MAHRTGRPSETVQVRIESRPAVARIRRERDGALIGETPFTESWLQGTGVEKLRLEREGYQSERVEIPLDRGLVTRIDLRRHQPPRQAARPRRPAAPLSSEPAKWDQLPTHTPSKWDVPLKPGAPAPASGSKGRPPN
jgi:hypothetical protein